MEYTIFTLLVPNLSFLDLGIGCSFIGGYGRASSVTRVLAVVAGIELRTHSTVRSASGGPHFRYTYAL